jgi:predicted amino acid racemase
MPKLTINLTKLGFNARSIVKLLEKRNISLMAVTKVVLGNVEIARALIKAGIKFMGDSRIDNIKNMKINGINAKFSLIRVPSLREIPDVVKYADYSVNSELETIKMLSIEAQKQEKIHSIILMIDMGDLREGIDPSSVDLFVSEILKMENIRLAGIGTNLKCFGGVIPTKQNMDKLSEIAKEIQNKFNIDLELVSGGNSANFNWLLSNQNCSAINNLRIGETLFFGKETINFKQISNLYTDVVKLSAEIIEIKRRNTIPNGIIVSNAFGEIIESNQNEDNIHNIKSSKRNQALLNIGRQDVVPEGLKPLQENIKVLGASSDYLIIDILDNSFKIGQTLDFGLNYEALLRAMTSPYIEKEYTTSIQMV